MSVWRGMVGKLSRESVGRVLHDSGLNIGDVLSSMTGMTERWRVTRSTAFGTESG